MSGLQPEIQAFVGGHRINFPWASDIATFLELGNNAAVFQVTDEDVALLAEIQHGFFLLFTAAE